MKKILVLGAGRSSPSLIKYLLDHSQKEGWHVAVGDASYDLAKERVHNHERGTAIKFDMADATLCEKEFSSCDVVVSLLPPALHIEAATYCLRFKKNLVTASYVTPQMMAMHDEVTKAGILFMNEAGLDPGIDHMSAMQIIDRLKSSGADLKSFKSYTGGLIAPESNDNPWGYKFTWNPRNVILAGQDGAHYRVNGAEKYIPYQRLFLDIENVHVSSAGDFDGYANRNSLEYLHHYGIENIPALLRGTLRYTGFCKAWNVFVKLGLTGDSKKISGEMTYSDLVRSLVPSSQNKNLVSALKEYIGDDADDEAISKAEWTGILNDEKIPLKDATPAQILQELLERKWKLKENDKDMIVMHHLFEYSINKKNYRLTSDLVVKGTDRVHTAMAETVGLPAAIITRLILNEKIKLKGVHIPVMKEVYEPVMSELEKHGIIFREKIEAF